MKDDGYESMRQHARNDLTIGADWMPGCPGTMAVVATIPCLASPAGIVWITFTGNSLIESQHSFVDPRVRRCGIRTRMHKWMLRTWPDIRKIVASGGTDDGVPWMKSTGFKKNKKTGDWEYTRKKTD